MSDVGIVSVDVGGWWLGGRYYLQHIVKSVALLPEDERVSLCDVWWQKRPVEDYFSEVRTHLSKSVVIDYPHGIMGRAYRKLRRVFHGWPDARDLFFDAGIGVLFPSLPCESPGIPYVAWIPDFQYRYFPDQLGEERCRGFEAHFQRNVSSADFVILSSENSMKDFRAMFPEAIEKARVVHFASMPDDSWWRRDPVEVASARGLDAPFFVISNQFNYYKNHEIIFEAVRILKERGVGVRVICTGNTRGFVGDEYFERLLAFRSSHNLNENITIAGLIPRDEQIALIRRSVAMLQPSKFEGWATSVEDARTLGKTILVSDIEVHREQLGTDHSFYLPLDNAVAWADAMQDVLANNSPGPHAASEVSGLELSRQSAGVYGKKFCSVMKDALSLTEPCSRRVLVKN